MRQVRIIKEWAKKDFQRGYIMKESMTRYERLEAAWNLEEADRMPASRLVQGTTTEVEEYCRKLIKDCVEGGGFILATECETSQDSKRDNARAIIESAIKYGQY